MCFFAKFERFINRFNLLIAALKCRIIYLCLFKNIRYGTL